MKYTLENGKTINIPDIDIENTMKLGLTKEEAIDEWLMVEGYVIDEEFEKFCAETSKVKHEARAKEPKAESEKKEKKIRVPKVSEEKKQVFQTIAEALKEDFGENVEIATENKLIFVKVGEKIIKIDIIEQKKPKK